MAHYINTDATYERFFEVNRGRFNKRVTDVITISSEAAVNLAASRSNAWSNGWGTTFWNSELTAGKLLSVDSGRDWALSGAKATGETVLALVGSKGSGNLTLVSPQDESFYQAKEQSYGFNASIPIYGGGSAPPSLGLSASGLKLLAENESIKQQSSIVSGIGGYDIRVNGHTLLKGSAIASKGDRRDTQLLPNADADARGWLRDFADQVICGESSSNSRSLRRPGAIGRTRLNQGMPSPRLGKTARKLPFFWAATRAARHHKPFQTEGALECALKNWAAWPYRRLYLPPR